MEKTLECKQKTETDRVTKWKGHWMHAEKFRDSVFCTTDIQPDGGLGYFRFKFQLI